MLGPSSLGNVGIHIRPDPNTIRVVGIVNNGPAPLSCNRLCATLRRNIISVTRGDIVTLAAVHRNRITGSFDLSRRAVIPSIILVDGTTFSGLDPRGRTIVLGTTGRSVDCVGSL